MNVEERVLAACEKYEQRMKEVSDGILPAEHGIYPSEMLCVCAMCEELDVDLIVESGRQYGYSTQILADWFVGRRQRIVSIDLDEATPEVCLRIQSSANARVTLIQGDGVLQIPRLVEGVSSVVLMDGPKYDIALSIAEKIIGQVKAVFIHDMAGLSCDPFSDQSFITDAASFDRYRYLDVEFLTALGYPPDSPGGGLAVILPHS